MQVSLYKEIRHVSLIIETCYIEHRWAQQQSRSRIRAWHSKATPKTPERDEKQVFKCFQNRRWGFLPLVFACLQNFFLDQLKKLSQKECYRHLTKPRKKHFVIGGTPPSYEYAFRKSILSFIISLLIFAGMSKRLRFGNQIVTVKKRLPNKITFEVTRPQPEETGRNWNFKVPLPDWSPPAGKNNSG